MRSADGAEELGNLAPSVRLRRARAPVCRAVGWSYSSASDPPKSCDVLDKSVARSKSEAMDLVERGRAAVHAVAGCALPGERLPENAGRRRPLPVSRNRHGGGAECLPEPILASEVRRGRSAISVVRAGPGCSVSS